MRMPDLSITWQSDHTNTLLMNEDEPRCVCMNGEYIRLPLHAWRYLLVLVKRAGTHVSFEMFLSDLYSNRRDLPNRQMLATVISNLKKKLPPLRDVIENTWGRGYILHTPETKMAFTKSKARWTPTKKEIFIQYLRVDGTEDLCRELGWSDEERRRLERSYDLHGSKGLYTTRVAPLMNSQIPLPVY